MERLGHKRIFQALMLATVACNVYYLSYRIGHTLNFSAPVFTFLFLAAEAHGFLSLWLFFFDVWSPRVLVAPPPVSGAPSVDVFVPTYNEDVSLLHRTLLAAKEMRLPHETYVLDDGARPEVERLARQLGVQYLARPLHDHAKAGNINYALERTRGELIVIFDADHVPQPSFLERTLGYFEDPRVGFVQTPHVFYNFGSFQTTADFRARQYWDDQQLFFRVIQPGKQRWGAAFFCGSCGVIRRACLDQIGGLDVRTITEDLHSSLRIQSYGWKSVYHDEHLATGLSPGDLGAYWKQRMRWAVGNLSVLWHENPLFKPGLTLSQRLSYFSSIWAWTVGPQKLVFYLAPPFMLLTGLYPIANFDLKLLGLYAANLAVSLGVYKLLSRGYGRIIRGELYSMVNSFMLTGAMIRALFGLGTRQFVVTRKGGRSEHVLAYTLPQIALVLGTYGCGLWALLRHVYAMAQDMTLVTVSAAWSVYNALLALTAAHTASRRIDIRRRYRFQQRLPVRFRIHGADPAADALAVALDFHDHGMALRACAPVPAGAVLDLVVHLPGGERVQARGRVLHERPVRGAAGFRDYGIAFTDLPPEDHARLDRFIVQYVIPASFHFLSPRRGVMRRAAARLFRPKLPHRRHPRRGVQIPVAFRAEARPSDDDWLLTDDLSLGGMAILSFTPRPLAMETAFTLSLPDGPLTGRAWVVREQRLLIGERDVFRCGYAFTDLSDRDRARIEALSPYAYEEEARG